MKVGYIADLSVDLRAICMLLQLLDRCLDWKGNH